MGILHLLVPRRDALSPTAVERAYVTGIDEVPWVSRIEATADGLIVDRPVTDTGNFHIPWTVEGYGETVLTTGSLMERSQPYLLELELARGTLNRIRNQLAAWELAGLQVPGTISDRMHNAVDRFAQAATSQSDPAEACRLAGEVISISLEITVALGASYAQQALTLRHASAPKLLTLLGASLGQAPLNNAQARIFLGTFNSALLPLPWRQVEAAEGKQNWLLADTQVEWCQSHGLKMCSGPLIQFDGTDVPDWLYLWEDDVENVMSFVSDYVRRVVDRYKGRFQVWQCAARINTGSFLGISPQNKIRMALRVVEIARELDARTPIIITLDQPWGEYVSRQEADLPLHLADTLLRSGMEVSGLGLELNVGYYPGGTGRRDVLEFSRQLDRWSLLGLPLVVTLVVPSGRGDDPQARLPHQPTDEAWSRERQDAWVQQYLPVLLSKTAVQAVMWNQLCDSQPHEYVHGGLLDAESKPKPVVASLANLRHQHLA
ncbi:MAG: endo-1,4-beta-xylanase [Planctomycetota bacterium]|nr:endo-1,4-beta-xylanase [Planctomycetota bacterium]